MQHGVRVARLRCQTLGGRHARAGPSPSPVSPRREAAPGALSRRRCCATRNSFFIRSSCCTCGSRSSSMFVIVNPLTHRRRAIVMRLSESGETLAPRPTARHRHPSQVTTGAADAGRWPWLPIWLPASVVDAFGDCLFRSAPETSHHPRRHDGHAGHNDPIRDGRDSDRDRRQAHRNHPGNEKQRLVIFGEHETSVAAGNMVRCSELHGVRPGARANNRNVTLTDLATTNEELCAKATVFQECRGPVTSVDRKDLPDLYS